MDNGSYNNKSINVSSPGEYTLIVTDTVNINITTSDTITIYRPIRITFDDDYQFVNRDITPSITGGSGSRAYIWKNSNDMTVSTEKSINVSTSAS